MRVIAFLRRRWLETAWAVFAVVNFVVMTQLPRWETIPFHFIWVSLTLLYGFRVLSANATSVILGIVVLATGVGIVHDAMVGTQPWDEISEVPLMSAMFLAMVWHAHRRRAALRVATEESARTQEMLLQQERFLQDASHELRTPVTIARGHLELYRRAPQNATSELDIALDELTRMEHILERLLLLAKAGELDPAMRETIDVETFLEDVFMRWSEVAPRVWRLGSLATGTLVADPEALRIALDALLENAVKHTQRTDAIEIRSWADGDDVVFEVADEGSGIPSDALDRIWERFGRADLARTRSDGGVGLGLTIVDAIAKAHDGRCTVETSPEGSSFFLRLRGFAPAQAAVAVATPPQDDSATPLLPASAAGLGSGSRGRGTGIPARPR
jgi:signal transduction histidine kinase